MSRTKSPDIAADIAVIGGGVAGLAAAVAAAETGAQQVVLLEARRVTGGNAPFVLGFFAVKDRPRRPAGAFYDELFRKATAYTHCRVNHRLMHFLIEESAGTLDWLRGMGLEFVWDRRQQHGQKIPLYASVSNMDISTGIAVTRTLAENCRERGIEVLCQTRAKKLLTERSGRITGVLAETQNKEIRISAESVIIASGGFAGNEALIKKYLPSYDGKNVYIKGLPNRGEGQMMAAEAGATTDGSIVLEIEGPSFPWSSFLPTSITLHPHTVWVNRNGKRFAGEHDNPFLAANTLSLQPGRIAYTLFDAGVKKILSREENSPLKQQTGSKSWAETFEKELQLQASKGRVKIADDWDGIARWIGANPEVLKAAIDEYNAGCASQRDNFGKEPAHLRPLRTPPYYALRGCLNLLVTHGGIKVNDRLEVIDKEDTPIPGLYAAGVDTEGADADTYNFDLPGHSFGFSATSGRLAGKNAAVFVSGKK